MKLTEYAKINFNIKPLFLKLIEGRFKAQQLQKGHFLIKEGEFNQRVYFIETGLVRMYYEKEERQVNHFFFYEEQHPFFCSLESIYLNQNTTYNFQLLEDSTILSIEYKDVDFFRKRIDRAFEIELAKGLHSMSERLYDIQFKTAQARYQQFAETYPTLIQRISLGQISSYLGISQQTLSEIRGLK